ncbi:trypsin-like peptidase domain-containing protein [Peribacillus kribbensis]|uniref:trypsin-like peptidase domain-containing protein n=1 Tax=Peribacillus kribbensis TaxID=356658 RepID=UPI00040D8BA3|nr:trypsin-like peptidase domain-containing protein [Peribacillus kribbensis]
MAIDKKTEPIKAPVTSAKPVPKEREKPPKDVSKIIEDSLPKVFTIFSDLGQGSGFLINDKGDVLTNAHVVEGNVTVTLENNEGEEFQGTVIGYSNDVDIALIRVNSLAGKAPFTLETSKESKLGDEVIALGSPRGFENTATLGNISGVNRSFVIEPHTYEGIYQISAPIAPGSSGGPLLDKNTEKVIAINSARLNSETNIGFSIPVFRVMDTIKSWAASPMSENEIADLFHNEDGALFYQDLYGNDSYFDGGSYSDEYNNEYQEYDDDPSAGTGDEYNEQLPAEDSPAGTGDEYNDQLPAEDPSAGTGDEYNDQLPAEDPPAGTGDEYNDQLPAEDPYGGSSDDSDYIQEDPAFEEPPTSADEQNVDESVVNPSEEEQNPENDATETGDSQQNGTEGSTENNPTQ